MTKHELIELLDSLEIKINEGIQNDGNTNIYPRIVYWEFLWESLMASGKEYNTRVTYQISMFYQKPRDAKLLELKNKLKAKGIFPNISHEYVSDDKHFHSYMSLEVLENV